MHVILGALQELRAEVLEDEGDAQAARLHEVEGDQAAGDVGAHAERTEVHCADVAAPGAPVQRDDDLAAPLVDLHDRRLHEVEQEDVAQRPHAHAERFLPEALHRRTLAGSIFRRAYGRSMRS